MFDDLDWPRVCQHQLSFLFHLNWSSHCSFAEHAKLSDADKNRSLFTAQRYMRKRGLRCRPLSLRPSVRLSVTLVNCIQTAEDIVKLFLSRPGTTIILVLVFFVPSAGTQFQREPLQQRRKIHGGGKNENFAIFDWNRRLSRKRYTS